MPVQRASWVHYLAIVSCVVWSTLCRIQREYLVCYHADANSELAINMFANRTEVRSERFSEPVTRQQTFARIERPSAGVDWPAGVPFVNALIAADWLHSSSEIISASWEDAGTPGAVQLTFTTVNGTLYIFSSESCRYWNNCPPTDPSMPGQHCWTHQSCCGSLDPECIDVGETMCCSWYEATAPCNADETCCGGVTFSSAGADGPEDQHNATCCPPGSRCCNIRAAGYLGPALCCASDETCDMDNGLCIRPAPLTTSAPARTGNTTLGPSPPDASPRQSTTTIEPTTSSAPGTVLPIVTNSSRFDDSDLQRTSLSRAHGTFAIDFIACVSLSLVAVG
jgi:hypothetical protein